MGDYKHKVSVTLVLDSPYDEKFSNLPFEEVVETLTSKYNDLLKKLHCEDHVVYFETDRPCAYQNGWYYNVGNAQCYFSTDSVTVNIPINVDYLLSVL